MPVKERNILLAYAPRAAFMPFHNRTQRWASLVVHRRGGKTVAVANDIIKRALEKAAPYAYIAPFRAQAKSVAWEYFKYYAKPLLKGDPNEADLKIRLVNESTVQLFGADNADAMRGLGFGGAGLDEYGDFKPSVWGSVIRPTLSERRGWAVFMGTPKGHNQFYDLHRIALTNGRGTEDAGNYFAMVLRASESGILHPDELRSARAQSTEDQYNQEYECSFDAAILGAFYGREMSAVDRDGRIGTVPHDPEFPVHTAWDLGHTDDTAIWFYQNIGNQIRILDCHAESGGTIEEFTGDDMIPGSITRQVIRRAHERGYRYSRHWLPHDARAKTLGSNGKSTVEKLARYLGMQTLQVVPSLSIQDGIQAARSVLGRCFFDARCGQDPETGAPSSISGIEALRQYQREYDEDKKAFRTTPLHNWASHYADGFRMLAVAEKRKIVETIEKKEEPKFKSVHTMTLNELWEAHEEAAMIEARI